jgi:hypothetical protein
MWIARRDPDDHAFAGTGEQDTVFVKQILAGPFLLHALPSIAPPLAKLPSRVRRIPAEVIAPADPDPIKL